MGSIYEFLGSYGHETRPYAEQGRSGSYNSAWKCLRGCSPFRFLSVALRSDSVLRSVLFLATPLNVCMIAFMWVMRASFGIYAQPVHLFSLSRQGFRAAFFCIVRACLSDARVPALDVMQLVPLARASAVLFAELEMVRWSAIVLFALAAAIGAQFYGYG